MKTNTFSLKSTLKVVLTLWVGFFLLSPSYGKPLQVKSLNALDVETSMNLNSTIVYIEDEEDALNFQDIQTGRFTDPLQQQAGRIFNIGISDSTYWFFFKLNHFSEASKKPVERLIEIPYPPLDRIDVFTLNLETNEMQAFKSGDSLYFNERPIVNNNHLFSVQLNHNEEAFIAIRVKSKGSLRIPIKIWHPAEFYSHSQTTTLFMGLYFGIMFIMFFYNACIYVATKDPSYLQYIAYIGAIALFQGLMHGYAGEYIWPETPIMNDKMLNATVLAICCSGLMFVRTLLDLKTHLPSVDKQLSWIIRINAFLIPITVFLPYVPTLKYSVGVGILTAGFALFVGTKLAIQGFRTARFFILAWFCLLVGAVIMGAVSAGLLPANVLTTNAFLVGSAIEASLLSLTLADHMNTVQRERAIAERKAKNALEKANRALTESNRTKDEFLATISHELRTPMNGVLTCISHLHEEQEPSKQRNFLGLAEQSANHMMLLVDGILSYAELQSKKFVLNKSLFNTHWLTTELDTQFQKLCADKGIVFSSEIKEDVPKYLFGDAAKVLQVLSNLTDNAIKFTETGFVKVSLDIDAINKKQQTVDLVFSVEDSGIGIPNGSDHLIYSKFKQLDGSNTRSHGGLGIGLTICKEIASHMHASVDYQSIVGEGTKFTFAITLKYSMQPNLKEEEIARQRYPLEELTRGKLALIAEDNAVNAMILKALLEKIGLSTIMATNGTKAVELVREQAVDIVLMDCQMPEMDGLEATQKIRKMEGDKALTPIIAVTANATSVDRNKCIEAGMNDYLSKPLNKQELLEKLTQWLPLDHTEDGEEPSNSNVTPLRPGSN